MSNLGNQPAFPLFYEYERSDGATVLHYKDGITLRQYFAGQSMANLVLSVTTNPDFAAYIGNLQKHRNDISPEATLAHAACAHADALITELEKTTKQS